jgi:hypothetical protein
VIRITLFATPETARELKPLLDYVNEKLCGERADSHDTATKAYVVLRKIRDQILRASERYLPPFEIEQWASNEFARATLRELSMYLGFVSDRKSDTQTFSVFALRELLDAELRRQDGEKWAAERKRARNGRPSVREARGA